MDGPEPSGGAAAVGGMDLDRFVPALLTFIANRLTNSGSATYRRRFGIGMMDFRILAMLSIESGISGARIVEVIDLDKAAVSRTLASLEKRGLVSVAPGVGRARILRLTAEGRKIYDAAWQVALERENRLLSGLSEEERELLIKLLLRLLAATPHVAELVESQTTADV
jgi:DNA-binding MarR family transcriptional regulator